MQLLQDVRYGFRMLLKNPVATAVSVVTLALGIGANSAILSVIDGIWLRPLPIDKPRELVRISNLKNGGALDSWDGSSHPEYLDYRTRASAFTAVAAVNRRGALLRSGGESRLLVANVVSSNYFFVLRVGASLGRTFTEEELSGENPPPVVMLSYSAWQEYFAGDFHVMGRTITLNRTDCVIIGILPRGFRGTELFVSPDLWIPESTWLQMNPRDRDFFATRDMRGFQLFGRLAPGMSIGSAQAQLDAIARQLAQTYPNTDAGRKVTVTFEHESRSPLMKLVGTILGGVAAVVLLIACANVSTLLLARGEARRREVALRIALGASRSRLLRQILTESLLLSLTGTVCAVVLAAVIVQAAPALLPRSSFPLGFDFRLDGRILGATMVLALISAILFGLAPAFQAAHVAPISAMNRTFTGSERQRHWGFRSWVVVVQIALSLPLLDAAGLLVKTLLYAERVDVGFDRSQNVALLDLGLRFARYDTGRMQRYYNEVITRLDTVPGVRQTAIARFVPFAGSGGGATKPVSAAGHELAPGDEPLNVWYSDITPSYFTTMGTRLIRGRVFTAEDRDSVPKVVIVNQTLVRRVFPGEGGIGKRLHIGGLAGEDWEIIGIVQDGKYNNVTEDAQPYLYLPLAQDPSNDVTVVVGTVGDPRAVLGAVKRQLLAIDTTIPILDVRTLAEHMRAATYDQRMTAGLIATLGCLGMVLAIIGLYGLVSYSVLRRTHEIGVRMAIGALPADVFRLVVKRGMLLAGAGTLMGIMGSLALTRTLASLLFGVHPSDPTTLSVVTALLLTVALLAAVIPARRATKVNPVVALRYE